MMNAFNMKEWVEIDPCQFKNYRQGHLQVYRVRRQIYTQRIRDQNGFGLTKAKLEARIIG